MRFSALNRLAGQEEYWRKCDEAGGEAFLEYEGTDVNDPLKKSIVTDKTLPYYVSPRRVAADAVAFSDGKGLPWYVARTSSEQLDRIETENDPMEANWSSLAILRRELRERPLESPDEIYITILKIREALFPEGKAVTPEFLAREYSGMSKVLDGRQWQEFSLLENEREHLREEDWTLSEEHHDTDIKELRSILEQDATSADESFDSLFISDRENEEREMAVQERVDRILDDIFTHMETFRSDTLSYLDRKLSSAEESGKLVEVRLTGYEDIGNDSALSPFGNIDLESLRIIRNLHTPETKELLGMDFSRLPLRAQIHFLSFRGKEKTSDAERFRIALKKHEAIADDLAYSFLATAEGPEYGEIILSLAERFDTDTLGPILRKYAEITRDADAVADYVRESFPNIEPTEVERGALAISKNLLRRGRDLLVDFSRETDADPEMLLRKLDDVNASVELYKKTYRVLRENGQIRSPNEMASTETAILRPSELTEEDKEWTRNLYRRSYPKGTSSERHREALFADLDKRLELPDDQARFYILRDEKAGRMGFVISEEKGMSPDGRPIRYVSSFNMEPEFQSDSIGSAFVESVFITEGEGAILDIVTDPYNRVTELYLRKSDFIGVGTKKIGDADRVMMRRDLKLLESLLTSRSNQTDPATKLINEQNNPFEYISFKTIRDRGDLIGVVDEMTEQGFYLTRLVPKGSELIAVFENPAMRKESQKKNTENRPAAA